MRARSLFLIIASLCLLTLPSAALADEQNGGGKIDPSVETALEATSSDDTAVPVLVYVDQGGFDDVESVLPAGVDTTELPLVDALAAHLTSDEIDAIASQDDVVTIVADQQVFGFDYTSSMDITNLTIGLGDVTAPKDGGPDGDGVTVAVIDSGVSVNTDLEQSRIIGWKDFVKNKKAPYDDAGHGTFVAGLIAGDGTASLPLEDGGYATVQFRGVAPAADIVGIKVLNASGEGRMSSMIAGIAWAIAHKDQYDIKVINLSIGSDPVGPVEVDPVALAVEAAWKAGITVVCAAGNDGEFGAGAVLSPGNSPWAITVGATDTRQTADVADDAVANYSSYGPTLWDEFAKPDVVAPGNRLFSLRVIGSYIDENFPENVTPVSSYAPGAPEGTVSNYLMLSGTSTSAPVTAGAVALMLQQDPSLTPDDVKLRLMNTADPVQSTNIYQQGAGLIDVDEALTDTSKATEPTLSADLGDGTTVLTDDTYAAWDQRVWAKYGWTKYRWTKYRWTKYRWVKYRWTKYRWTKYRWTKYRWTEYEWAKYRWTTLIEGQ